jgi:hypothetical protein
MDTIARLLQHETGGDPMQDLKWSRRAIRKIARQLRRLKIRVSASTVRRLLKQLGFSLRVNHKRLESGNRNPPPRPVRNRQFTVSSIACTRATEVSSMPSSWTPSTPMGPG